MKKIILMLMFFTLTLEAETIEFFGNYKKYKNSANGCIYSGYNGKDSMKNIIRVYSNKNCPNTKTRFSRTFSCDIKSLIEKYTKKETNAKYEIYDGTCEVIN